VERDGEVYSYAGWIEDRGDVELARATRMRVMRGILDELGLIARPSP
jgi:hypothetical protein